MSGIPASTVISVCKRKLVGGIAALPAFTTPRCRVDWSDPGHQIEERSAWVGDFRGQQNWKTFGDRSQEVAGDASVFECVIFVVHKGATADAVEQEALTLLAGVEDWLRVNETAGIDLSELPGCKHLRLAVHRVDLRGGYSDKARACQIEFDISLTARI